MVRVNVEKSNGRRKKQETKIKTREKEKDLLEQQKKWGSELKMNEKRVTNIVECVYGT